MKFSLVNGERREAEKELLGTCIGCEQPTIPKCGPIKVKHWAHKSRRECDRWWENETEWHRTWKNHFPTECQEFRQQADDGEWHIVDVKTKQGHFLEFQHSFLKSEERTARNAFYGKDLVWVVDAKRRMRDQAQFDKILNHASIIDNETGLSRLPPNLDRCSLLREWSECKVPVFFDFGSDLPLWCLLANSEQTGHYVGRFPRVAFTNFHNGGLNRNQMCFDELMLILNGKISSYESRLQTGARGIRLPIMPNFRPRFRGHRARRF